MTFFIDVSYTSTWAHPDQAQHTNTEVSYVIKGTAHVRSAIGPQGPLVAGKKLHLNISYSSLWISDNGADPMLHLPGTPYVLNGDGTGTFIFYLSAPVKAIHEISYVVEDDPDSAKTCPPSIVSFVSYNDASTEYPAPPVPVDEQHNIIVTEDSFVVSVPEDYKEFTDDPNAHIALLINDQNCTALDADIARKNGFTVRVNWLKDTDYNQFAFIATSAGNAVTSPSMVGLAAGKIYYKPQPDSRRTLDPTPVLDRGFAIINASNCTADLDVKITIPKASAQFKLGDIIQVYFYINGYWPATRLPKNDKIPLPAINVTAADITALQTADVIKKTKITVAQMADIASSASHQPGDFYLDYEVTTKGATEADRMAKQWSGGTINTYYDL